jgi:hypothetical protein
VCLNKNLVNKPTICSCRKQTNEKQRI